MWIVLKRGEFPSRMVFGQALVGFGWLGVKSDVYIDEHRNDIQLFDLHRYNNQPFIGSV